MTVQNRIAACSWSLQPKKPADLLPAIRSLEIDAIQLDLTPLCRDPQMWYPLLDLLTREGIRIISGMMAMEGEDYSTLDTIARTGGVRPDATWPVNLARAEMVAALAGELGLDLVTFHAGFLPEDDDDGERAKLVTRLRTLADVFAAVDVALGFETGQETAPTLLDVLAEIDRPTVGVNFDPANMILYDKGDPVEAVRLLAPYVRQVHIKDAVATTTPGTWGTEVPAGEGGVDWPAFLAITETLDPAVDYVIEREAGGSRVDDIRAARALVTQVVGEVVSSGGRT